MIRVAALIEELSQVGVTLSKNGDEIVLDGPAVVLTDDLIEELRAHKSEILATFGEWDSADWQAFFDERAGIAEFDRDVSRQEAEDHALECCIVEWLNRHREPSDPSQCAHCRRPDRSEHVVVPFGTVHHTWLHPECWAAWHKTQRVQAIAALSLMGIVRPIKLPSDVEQRDGTCPKARTDGPGHGMLGWQLGDQLLLIER